MGRYIDMEEVRSGGGTCAKANKGNDQGDSNTGTEKETEKRPLLR